MNQNIPENQDLSFLTSLYTAGLCITFGANAVAIKISMAGIGPLTAAGLRFSMASVAILLWARATGRPLHFKREQALQVLILCALFTVQLALFYLGLNKTNASRGTLLANLQPFFILLLAHFFIPGDRMTVRKTIGILMGFLGVVFMFTKRTGVTEELIMGDMLVLSAVVIWACNVVYMKRVIAAFSPFHLVLYPMIFSIPFFFLAGAVWDRPMIGEVDARVLVAMLYQGFITASFGFVAWTTMLKKYGAVALHSYIFLLPITGVLLGGLLLGEPVAAYNILLALAFIVTGIIVVHSKLSFSIKPSQ
jgi:drug/metabolite transporter (DMT)-like permease